MIAPTTGPVIQNGRNTNTNRPAMPNLRTVSPRNSAAWCSRAREASGRGSRISCRQLSAKRGYTTSTWMVSTSMLMGATWAWPKPLA